MDAQKENIRKIEALTSSRPPTDEKAVEFVPLGASDKIRLTAAMVRAFIAVPTRTGLLPSERDCIRFIMLCRGKRANPFEGDVFMIGYDTKEGPSFSMVCGIELFLKRSEQEKNYDGRESGIIVKTSADQIEERPGCLLLDGEKLLGGWAKVYRKDHSHPDYKTVNFSTYNTTLSRWAKDPAGQIEKVALSQALRQAFPTPLGGLYTQEEMERVTQTGEGLLEIREPIKMPELKAANGNGKMPDPPAADPTPTDVPVNTADPVQKFDELETLKKIFLVSVDQCKSIREVEALVKKAKEYGLGDAWLFDFGVVCTERMDAIKAKNQGRT